MIDDLSVLLNIREAVLNALVGSGVEYIGAFENIPQAQSHRTSRKHGMVAWRSA